MRYFLALLTVCQIVFARAQSVSTLMGAQSAGIGYASATLKDPTSILNNVGSMAYIESVSMFFSSEVTPAIPGTKRTAAGFSIPTRIGVFGSAVFRFGDELYREQILAGGFSHKLGLASLGASASIVQYSAEGYATRNAWTFNFGGLAQITPVISVGAYILNVTQASIFENEKLPTRMVAGIGFRPVAHFFFSSEIEKDLQFKTTWRTGAEYTILKKVFVRTGFNLNPNCAYAGLGVKIKRIAVDYAIRFNSVTGETHAASAVYSFGKNNKK